jgi:hypothetical protein
LSFGQSNSKRLKENQNHRKIVIYDTVRITDTVYHQQKRIKIKELPKIESKKGFIFSDLISSTATNFQDSIILNENLIKSKSMKRSILSIATILITLSSYSQDTISNSESKFYMLQKNKYHSIALGAGLSYGAMGLKYQARYGDVLGYGYQVGVGVSLIADNGKILESRMVSLGAKIYPYKWFFLNTQIATHTITTIEYLALMTGGDWFINKYIGFNAGLGIYFGDSNINPMFDIGISYKF